MQLKFLARAVLAIVALVLAGSTASAIDWRRINSGDTVIVAADGTDFYVERVVAARLSAGTELKVIELSGSKEGDPVKVWVGTTVTIRGEPKSGWVHSRKLYKRDDAAAVAALKKFEKVKLENDYLGTVIRIDANDSDITGEALAHVKGLYNLEGLELSGTKITDDDLAHLADLTNLQWLYLDNTKISDRGLVHLKGLANLDVLALNKTQVTGSGLSNLRDLKRLRVLNLSECKITDAALENIRGLVQIQTLALQAVPITGEGLKHLQGMPRLNVLNLNHTKLASGSLLHLRGSKELRILHLEGAEVDPKDEEELEKSVQSLAIFH